MDTLKLKPILNGKFLSAHIFVNEQELVSESNVPDLFNIKRAINFVGDSEKYPIFNCSCGIAECGGIKMNITSTEDNIIWRMHNPQKFSFIFDKKQYSDEFKQFQKDVQFLIRDREDLQEQPFFKKLLS